MAFFFSGTSGNGMQLLLPIHQLERRRPTPMTKTLAKEEEGASNSINYVYDANSKPELIDRASSRLPTVLYS